MRTINDLANYQKHAVMLGIKHNIGAIFTQTGLGKTAIALTLYDQLRKRNRTTGCLVVAPLRVVYAVWRQEAALWEHTHKWQFNIIHGDAAKGSAETVRRRMLLSPADVWLTNYETLPWLADNLVKFFRDKPLPFNTVFYDESTFMKHSTTVRFKYWKNLMFAFRQRYVLSGTPMPNGYLDLFGQYYVMDAGARLGQNITSYKNAYFYGVGVPPRLKYLPRRGAPAEIKSRVKDITVVLRKEDYAEIPPLKYNIITLDLPDKLRGTYDELENDLVTEIESERIRITNAMTAMNKLRQFLSGRVYQEGGTRSKILHTVKLDMLKDIREGLDVNVITAFNYRFESEDLVKYVYPKGRVIQGQMSTTDVAKSIQLWNSGKLRDLLINPAAAAHGLNLQSGGFTMLWYSLTVNLEHFDQLRDRLHRRGQEHVVMVHLMVFRNTVEERLAQLLANKDRTQKDFIDTLKTVVRR